MNSNDGSFSFSPGSLGSEDETEGHAFSRGVMDEETPDEATDAEGHSYKGWLVDEDETAEGHGMKFPAKDDDDDAEGHVGKGHP